MESYSKPKIKPSGRSKVNAPCKKHSKHKQSPGVCSICLCEKLSQLTNHNYSSQTKARKPQSSSSSYSYLSSLSSSNASSNSSPVVINYRKSNTRVFKNISGKEMFKKSRSMAFAFQRRQDDEDENGKNLEKKRGFWSKLLLPRRNNKGLMHSRTTRERVSTAVH